MDISGEDNFINLSDEDVAILLSRGYSREKIKYIDIKFTEQEQLLVVGTDGNGIDFDDIISIRDIENHTLFDKDRTKNTKKQNKEFEEQIEFIYDQLIKLMLEGATSREITDYYEGMRSDEDDLGVGLNKKRSNKKRSNKRRKSMNFKRRLRQRKSNKRSMNFRRRK